MALEWTEIQLDESSRYQAADFLDGVLLELTDLHRYSTVPSIVFVAGWRVEQQRGDMDGPNLRRRPAPELERLTLRARLTGVSIR
jgi:hypothetical protein